MSWRNPSLEEYLSFLKESDQWSEDELRVYQRKKCKAFLEFVYKYSPFYRDIFDKYGFNPSEFNDIEQLKNLPIFSKETLIENSDKIHSNFPFRKVFLASTSGTSGKVIKFNKNEEWDSHNRAAMYRGYSWYNVQPWEKNGYLWGYKLDSKRIIKIKFQDWLQNRFRLYTYNKSGLKSFASNLKGAKYLHGYSSVIYEIAKGINSSGMKAPHNLKLIKGTSEMIFDSYQEEVRKAFRMKMISEYGSAESGIIGFECPMGSIHLASENVIVEIENGEILVTNLLSKSFPIIRYRLGDSIELADKSFKCPCGRSHPVILEIQGRVGKKIVGKKKEYPSVLLNNFFKGLAMNQDILFNYQVIQNEKGQVTINIEQEELGRGPILEKELYNYFQSDIDFTIYYSKTLHKMNGKLKNFISTIEN